MAEDLRDKLVMHRKMEEKRGSFHSVLDGYWASNDCMPYNKLEQSEKNRYWGKYF